MSLLVQASIERKIRETKEEISSALQVRESPYKTLVIQQLKERLASLEKERQSISEARYVDTITLTISGEDVPKGKISNRVLISILGGFQLVSESVASALFGQKASKGQFPQFVKNITDYKFVSVFDGSFGVVLQKDSNESVIQSDDAPESAVINAVFSILEQSNSSADLIDNISPMGKRTIVNYKKWMYDLSESNVALNLGYKNRAAEYRSFFITPDTTKNVIDALDSIEDTIQEEQIIIGVLNAINLRNGTFELQTDGGENLKGKSTYGVLLLSKESLGKCVKANVIKTVTSLKSNISRTSWYLISVTESE